VEHGVVTSGKVTINSNVAADVAKIIDESFGEDAETILKEFDKKPLKERKSAAADDKNQE
jgi:ligand-binding sensor protein